MDPALLQRLSLSWIGFTFADVYPASECGTKYRRREPRWISARFFLIGSKASAFALPIHTSGLRSYGTCSSHHLLPSCCNFVGNVILLYSFCSELFSDGLRHFGSPVVLVLGQDRPHNSGIFVGKGHCNHIWMPPLTHSVDLDASGVLFSTSLSKNSSGSVDQKRTQVPITALADPKQPRLAPA